MIIEVCGPGCWRCHATEKNAKKALEELEKEGKFKEADEVAVTMLSDFSLMAARGVMLTPAVVIDGVKVSEGRIPEVKEIKKWIEERLRR